MELALPVGIVSNNASTAGFRLCAVGVATRNAELLNWGKLEEVSAGMLAQLGSNPLDCFNSLAGLSVLGLLLLLLHGSLTLFSRRGLRAALLRLRPIELVQVRFAKPVRQLLLLRVLPLRRLRLSLLMLLLHSLRLRLG